MTTQLSFHEHHFSAINRNNQIWLSSKDIAVALGYSKTNAITHIYNTNTDEFTPGMTEIVETNTSGNLKARSRIFSLRGAHLIAMFARTQLAKEFRKWVLDILDKEVGAPVNEQPSESTSTDDRTPLRDAVNMLVGKRGMAYDDAYKLIHHRFGVQHIDQLTQAQMLEAIEYIHCLVVDGPARSTAPLNGRLLLTFRNGEVVGSSMLPEDAHVATMAAFMDLARKAHYVVIHEDDAQPIIQLLTGKKIPARLPAKI
ncbi:MULTISPECIES: BRO-N domain-containing protein [Klebsiella/Raoultella group]|uniref:BRO-N domain-containing protein n=1 Tax=Klebsiella/Raoultella group TaxID=2890311 RepID=UPI000808D2EB|nr:MULTISPECIES: BRO family protein [Klebsiella/Raoultella group]MDC7940282.1 ORF6N domain-containing protein [Raoultella ornithinolytica]SBX09093.1 antirepressor protein Ant [Klebsiella pneumoniae]HEB4939147.1 ORF6N domain-containing protein [Klebsiella quasipneumoniae]